MTQARPRMTNLFEQLGLDSSEESIEQFIASHQLDANTLIADASYWSEGQRQFLIEKIKSDGEWALVVDQLNESLHEDSVKKIRDSRILSLSIWINTWVRINYIQ